jgi:hypothetical protein
MKKVLFLAVSLFAAVFAANAEESGSVKPAAGKVNVEVGFCPFSNLGGEVGLENGRLNGGYSINNNISVRAGLGWNVKSTDDEATDTKTDNRTISFAPGITYSFKGTNKFTPYIGGELIFEAGNDKTKVNGTTTEDLDNRGFGVDAFTGMNYYFSQNLYVGVEFGIGFMYTSKDEDNDGDNAYKTTSFAPYAQPSVRLGWVF